MNLIPTIISIGLAASVSFFYLQNQSDEPNKINYRAALSEFEQSTLELAAHTPLQNRSTVISTIQCENLNRDFVKKLPTGSGWHLNIAGLDCDIAELQVTTSDDNFPTLLSAAGASGRNYATETTPATATDPLKKTIKWTQRLYSRNASDLGINAKLKKNNTGNCLSCSSDMVHGDWSHKEDERWNGCPAPGELACGSYSGTRTCIPPLNGGEECQRINKTWTSPGNRTETRTCKGIPSCSKPTYNICPSNSCLNEGEKDQTWIDCDGPNPCRLNDGRVVEKGYKQTCNTPKCGSWQENHDCFKTFCLSANENDPIKRTCTGSADSRCIDKNNQLVTPGTTEKCNLSACAKMVKTKSCPSTVNNCMLSREMGQYEEQTCVGEKDAKCKYEGVNKNIYRYSSGQTLKTMCDSKACGILSEWTKPNIQCIPKNKHMLNDQPKVTRTCTVSAGKNYGCKDVNGAWFPPGISKKTLDLPGCAYWGEWSNSGQCKLDKKNKKGIQVQTRQCLKRRSNGVTETRNLSECAHLGGTSEQTIDCDYKWGMVKDQTSSCPKNCMDKNDFNFIAFLCLTNDAACKVQISDEIKIITSRDLIMCSDILPKCGTWKEWSLCEFTGGNDGYGSCSKKDGVKTRTCDTDFCKNPEGSTGHKNDTAACYSQKCQIDIKNSIDKTIQIDELVQGSTNRDIKIIISKESIFTAPSTDTCAINISNEYKSVTLINRGIITGHSGQGGVGAKPEFDTKLSDDTEKHKLNGKNGEDGGNALCIANINKNVNIENNGVIKGGRAGGGGGAACIADSNNVLSVSGECAPGGDGGNGSDSYLPSIIKGEWEKTIVNDTLIVQSGAGGNGGVLFKQGTLEVDLIPYEADLGKDAEKYGNEPNGIEFIGGKGGKPGKNGQPCRSDSQYSDIWCDKLK